MKLVVLTGLSGAGKTVALGALEDAGYDAIDNLPLQFISTIADSQEQGRKLVLTMDIRTQDFSPEYVAEIIAHLRSDKSRNVDIIYLDCDDEALQRRFTETRRRHPLALDRPVMDGIHQERGILSKVRSLADHVIDTTDMTAGDLRHIMSMEVAKDRQLSVTLMSFSYKMGLPRAADLVFDVRFLNNPHYVEELRNKTGQNRQVQEYIERDEAYAPFFDRLKALVLPLLPRYVTEGKSYLTIAIGCTGGKHRSVFVTQQLARVLQEMDIPVTVRHRDMPKGEAPK